MRRCVLLAILAAGVSSTLTAQNDTSVTATVFLSGAGKPSIRLGLNDTAKGCATAFYNASINHTGWDSLKIDASHALSAVEGAFCAGFAEGYLSQSRIHNMFRIVYADWFQGSTKPKVAPQVPPYPTHNLVKPSLCSMRVAGL